MNFEAVSGLDVKARPSKIPANFNAIFEAMPGYSILLATNSPVYTILATTAEYLELTGKTKENIVGKGFFEVFPSGSDNPDFTGHQNLNTSFQQVICSKSTNHQLVQRYDVENPDGSFSELYWRAINKPVLDDDGNVLYIIHTADNVTDTTIAEQQEEKMKGMKHAHDLFMQAPVAVGILKGPDLIVELANELLTDMWGKGKDVVGKPLLQIMPELNGQGHIELLYDVVETGKPYKAYETPITFIRAGKEDTGYFNFIYQPYYEPNRQKPVGVLLFINEVTERMLTKKELEKKEKTLAKATEEKQKLITLVEASQEFIGMAAPDRTISYCNLAALKMLGWNSFTGRTIDDCVYPDDYELAKKLMAERSKNQHFSHEIRFRNEKTGKPFWLQWNAFSLNDPATGNLLGLATVSSNITQRKQEENALQESEHFYRTLIEEATVATCLFTGPQMVVEYANNIMIGYWGKDSSVIGKPFIEAVPELEGQPFLDLIRKVYTTGETYYGNEEKADLVVNGKLQSFYFNYTYKAVRNRAGEIYAVHDMAVDVTSQVMAKKALEESEQNLRRMIMQAPMAICIFHGPEYRFEHVNAKMEEIMGRSIAEVTGRPLFEAMPEVIGSGLQQILENVFATGTSFTAHEQEFLLPRGNELARLFVDYIYEPLRDASGNVSGIMVVAMDVTTQVLARRKIEESEKKFRQLANTLPQMVWKTDPAGRQTFASERWKEYTGLDLQDETGLQQVVHPEDWENITQLWSDSLATGKGYTAEIRLKSKTGDYHWHFSQAVPIRDADGNITNWITTFADVHEQKIVAEVLRQSDENFRQLADLVPQIIWTARPNGFLDYYNKRWYDFTGFKEGYGDQSWIPILHPDDVQLCTDSWYHSVKTGEPYQIEYRFKDQASGQYRWFLGKALPIRDSQGVITKWFGTCTDIQAIKALDEQKDYFISLASHELKTPLTTIKAYVQVLQLKYKNHDVFLGNAHNTIYKQIEKINKLISDLLDVPKIQSGKLSLHKEQFPVNQLVQEAVNEIQQINASYNIIFFPKAEPLVYADKERIGQVLINLLTNAVKYSPNAKDIIVQSVVAGSELRVSVQDFGIGINKNDHQKIFERFYRVEGKDERKYSGFGIGLFVSSEIIQRHDGKIGVDSEPGKGSTFYFSLPVTNQD